MTCEKLNRLVPFDHNFIIFPLSICSLPRRTKIFNSEGEQVHAEPAGSGSGAATAKKSGKVAKKKTAKKGRASSICSDAPLITGPDVPDESTTPSVVDEEEELIEESQRFVAAEESQGFGAAADLAPPPKKRAKKAVIKKSTLKTLQAAGGPASSKASGAKTQKKTNSLSASGAETASNSWRATTIEISDDEDEEDEEEDEEEYEYSTEEGEDEEEELEEEEEDTVNFNELIR